MKDAKWDAGTKFGRFTLSGKSYYIPNKKKRYVEAICSCNKIKWVRFDCLHSGNSTSCGCWPSERMAMLKPATTHGLSDHPLYTVYKRMRDRCYDERHKSFKNYGGSGVKMCDEWVNDFQAFYDWGIDKWEEGLELDKDILYCKKNGGLTGFEYSPEYCQFVTPFVNGTRRRTSRHIELNGVTKTLTEWAQSTGLNDTTIACRIDNYGWSIEDALTKPLKRILKRKTAVISLAC